MLTESSQTPKIEKKTSAKINKILISGSILLIAIVLLVVTSLKGNAQYYLTVNELVSKSTNRTENIRVSGVVLGDSIEYDAQNSSLSFTVANIPGDNKEIEKLGGLELVLHQASVDKNAAQMKVIYTGERPDMLKNEAQAIMTGSLGDDGIFYADELLLKCPSRYEGAVPEQAEP